MVVVAVCFRLHVRNRYSDEHRPTERGRNRRRNNFHDRRNPLHRRTCAPDSPHPGKLVLRQASYLKKSMAAHPGLRRRCGCDRYIMERCRSGRARGACADLHVLLLHDHVVFLGNRTQQVISEDKRRDDGPCGDRLVFNGDLRRDL